MREGRRGEGGRGGKEGQGMGGKVKRGGGKDG